MKTLDDVLEEWSQDCEIPKHDLAEASRKTPNLHQKYLEVYTRTRLRLRQAEMDQRTLLKDKWMHYNGKMSKDDIDARNWSYDPLEGLKIMKGDMDKFYDADSDIQASEMKIQYLKEMCDTLKEILDNLKWRHQTIANMIKWKQFEAGV